MPFIKFSMNMVSVTCHSWERLWMLSKKITCSWKWLKIWCYFTSCGEWLARIKQNIVWSCQWNTSLQSLSYLQILKMLQKLINRANVLDKILTHECTLDRGMIFLRLTPSGLCLVFISVGLREPILWELPKRNTNCVVFIGFLSIFPQNIAPVFTIPLAMLCRASAIKQHGYAAKSNELCCMCQLIT